MYDLKFALEAKANEPGGDICNPTTSHIFAIIGNLDQSEMIGVNPEVVHEHVTGINFLYGVTLAWVDTKLLYIDVIDQCPGCNDQDLRFGPRNLKVAFFL